MAIINKNTEIINTNIINTNIITTKTITTMACSKNHIISLNHRIESLDIKGQYTQLAAPIILIGQLNVTALLTNGSLGAYQLDDHQLDDSQLDDEQINKPHLDNQPLQIGVDEAGRGPLLGSVNVAAALLPNKWSGLIENAPLRDTPLAILTDSKKLSEKKRDSLYPLVQQYAIGYMIADIPAAVIDQVNILQATMLGMRLCSEELLIAISAAISDKQNLPSVHILYDGNRCPELNYSKLFQAGIQQTTIDPQAWVKGDARHTSIAAASILAKVSRDQAMYALDIEHPNYGIAQHKGYPTRAHIQALKEYGVLDAHRRSFAPVREALRNK